MALVWIAVGIIIGWNLPQPAFAAVLQQKAVAWVKAQFASTPTE